MELEALKDNFLSVKRASEVLAKEGKPFTQLEILQLLWLGAVPYQVCNRRIVINMAEFENITLTR